VLKINVTSSLDTWVVLKHVLMCFQNFFSRQGLARLWLHCLWKSSLRYLLHNALSFLAFIFGEFTG